MARSSLSVITSLRNLLFLVILLVEAIGVGRMARGASFGDSVLIGGSGPADSKAQLDVKSTTKGVLLPRMTTTQQNAITSPTEGLLIYDNVLHQLSNYNGTAWVSVGAPPAAATATVLGTLKSSTAPSHQFGTGLTSGTGVLTYAQPAFSDISGTASLTSQVTGILPIANGGTAVGSVTIAPTASAWAGWDANKNFSANNLIDGYRTTATAAGTTTLTVSDAYQQYFTGTTTQTVKLPVVTTLVNGMQFNITNNSTGVVTVQSSGANTILAMAGSSSAVFTVVDTTAGTGTASWSFVYTPSVLPIANGGTGNGGISVSAGSTPYFDGTKMASVAPGSANQVYQSQGSSAPSWSTATFPGTATNGSILNASASNTWSSTVTPTIGVAGSSTGSVGLAGQTSGTVTIKPQAAAGTWEFDLPTTAGGAGTVLTSQGGAGSAMTWSSVLTNPATTAFDMLQQNSGNTALTRIAPNTTTTKEYLSMTGSGSAGAAAAWSQPAFSELSGSASAAQLPSGSLKTCGFFMGAACTTGTCGSVTFFPSGCAGTITWIGTGNYHVNFAGSYFSSAPACAVSNGTSNANVVISTAAATTSVLAVWAFVGNTGTATNTQIQGVCMGAY